MSLFKSINVVYAYVTDWEAAKKFYREILDWPVFWTSDQVGWEEYGLAGEPHVAINRWDRPGEPPRGNGVIGILTVDDPYQVTEALRARGVRCDDVVHIPEVVTYGIFYDPEGNQWQMAS